MGLGHAVHDGRASQKKGTALNSTAKFYSKWLTIFTAALCLTLFLGIVYVRAGNAAWSLYYGILSGWIAGYIRRCWQDYKADEQFTALIADLEAQIEDGAPVGKVIVRRGEAVIEITAKDTTPKDNPENESGT